MDKYIFEEEYDKEEARKLAIKYIIKEIEKLYGDLDYAVTESQGAMIDLFARFEQLNIYKEIINYLDPNYQLNYDEIVKAAVKRAYGKEIDFNKLYFYLVDKETKEHSKYIKLLDYFENAEDIEFQFYDKELEEYGALPYDDFKSYYHNYEIKIKYMED